ncbi:MAG: hypothetical protein RR614_05665, partial [Eubacterium sp.]
SAVLDSSIGKVQGGTIPKSKAGRLSEKIKNIFNRFLQKTSNPHKYRAFEILFFEIPDAFPTLRIV